MTYRRAVRPIGDTTTSGQSGQSGQVGQVAASFDHGAAACDAVARFARADLVGAALGLIVVVIANAVVVRSGLLWIVPPALLTLVIALVVAVRAAARGELLLAIGLVIGGNWLVAIVVPFALPFLWPILALVVVMPLVLAAPFVSLRVLVVLIVLAAGVVATVATIGLRGDDAGAIPDIADEFELALIVGALAALMVPIGLVVWLTHRSQRAALDAAVELNRELEASRRRLVESRRRVVAAGDAARSRIERDLHDGAQQHLIAVAMKARLLAAQIDDDHEALVHDLVDDVDRAVDELRELAHGIYPPVLEAHGLGDALGAAARRSAERVVIANGIGDRRLGRPTEEALYFTALEAMSNAAKHAPGSEVRVLLGLDAAGVELRVEDDGPGFDPHAAAASRGLTNMRDRVESLGGTFDVARGATTGTTVRVTAPITA